MRIGSTQPRKADFRLVCATNRPLLAEVRAGRFREDLYYRIAVVSITLPPLREREGDIVALATHFLDHYNAKFGKACGPFTPAAMRALETCRWEGNVRQLQHCIERAVALHAGGPVESVHLFPSGVSKPMETKQAGSQTPQASLSYQEARSVFEREYLQRLLDETGGNVSEAARLSGIPRQNFYVKVKRWGLSLKNDT
jgi:DNA-binding NtrC family response regulator